MPALFHSIRGAVAALKTLRVRWVLAAAVPLVGVLWLSGCENTLEYSRYPADLVYPLRTDLIVTKKPPSEVFAPPEPGHLDEEIAQVAKIGGETVDPNGVAADPRKLIHAVLNKVFGTPRQPHVGAAERRGRRHGRSAAAAAEGPRRRRKAPLPHARHGQQGLSLSLRPLPRPARRRPRADRPVGRAAPARLPPRQVQVRLLRRRPTGNKPRRDDLLRTLHQGIDGTSMPSFALLSDERTRTAWPATSCT